MYYCNNCRHKFIQPRTVDDEKLDESYDVCPKCGDDDFVELESETDDDKSG